MLFMAAATAMLAAAQHREEVGMLQAVVVVRLVVARLVDRLCVCVCARARARADACVCVCECECARACVWCRCACLRARAVVCLLACLPACERLGPGRGNGCVHTRARRWVGGRVGGMEEGWVGGWAGGRAGVSAPYEWM